MARIRDEQAQSLGYEDVLPGAGMGVSPTTIKQLKAGYEAPPDKPGPAPVPAAAGMGGIPSTGPLYQLGGAQGGALPFPGMEAQLDPSAQLLASLEQYRMALIQAIFAHLTGGGLG